MWCHPNSQCSWVWLSTTQSYSWFRSRSSALNLSEFHLLVRSTSAASIRQAHSPRPIWSLRESLLLAPPITRSRGWSHQTAFSAQIVFAPRSLVGATLSLSLTVAWWETHSRSNPLNSLNSSRQQTEVECQPATISRSPKSKNTYLTQHSNECQWSAKWAQGVTAATKFWVKVRPKYSANLWKISQVTMSSCTWNMWRRVPVC